ncbi:threonine synthase [Isachenkonia alkalipeptolytica]
MEMYLGLLEQYKKELPITENTPMVSLQEGNTPLIYAGEISKRVGAKVYLKYEGMNPTGSFKDRGMVMAVAKAMEEGSEAIICASTGNTSASAAAYAARSGLKCIVLIPEGKIAQGKLAQAYMHGATVISIEGNFDKALEIVKSISKKHPITLVNSINPYRIQGQKTAAFEVCDQLEKAPDYLAIPVGNAGNITAYWQGFKEYYRQGLTDKKPRMLGFQAEGASPIVQDEAVEHPETIATAIRIGNPASWEKAKEALRESQGMIDSVSDEEITEAYHLLARQEGVFVEPASAASVAGLLKNYKKLGLTQEDTVVCVNTGNGLKDPNYAISTIKEKPEVVPATEKEILKRIL